MNSQETAENGVSQESSLGFLNVEVRFRSCCYRRTKDQQLVRVLSQSRELTILGRIPGRSGLLLPQYKP